MGNQNATPWSDERTAELTKMYADGYSAGLIADRFGLSRNSVIGKIFRLGLIVPKKNRVTKQREAAPKKPVERRAISRIVTMGGGQRIIKTSEAVERPELRCAEIDPRHLDIIDLNPGDCRYPFGDGPFTFCGHPVHDRSSYCTAHFMLCREEPRRLVDKKFARAA